MCQEIRVSSLALGILLSLVAVGSHACLWDYDTLEMERQRFPGSLELITGKFLRHSEAYYLWRIEDRLEKISSDSSPSLYDDLAVAYEKIGNHGKAIETALESERLYPGRYETAANLGTFYIHSGDFRKGIEYIEFALQINPEAHFGRERYQKLLVEYLLSKQIPKRDLSLPLDPVWPEEVHYTHESRGFARYCDKARADPDQPFDPELIAFAIVGVEGMMKFGNHDSPILLEALGDLLLAGHRDVDMKRLAARAYLRASEVCGDVNISTAYRDLAVKALEIHVAHDQAGMPPMMTIEKLEKNLKVEVEEAEEWFENLTIRERDWIASNADVDAEFKRVYYAAPSNIESPQPPTYRQIINRRLLLVLFIILVVAFMIFYSMRLMLRESFHNESNSEGKSS